VVNGRRVIATDLNEFGGVFSPETGVRVNALLKRAWWV
jgi:hypothetical protein